MCPFKEIETLTTIAENALAAFDAIRPVTTADVDDHHYGELVAVQDATVSSLLCPRCRIRKRGSWCRFTA